MSSGEINKKVSTTLNPLYHTIGEVRLKKIKGLLEVVLCSYTILVHGYMLTAYYAILLT